MARLKKEDRDKAREDKSNNTPNPGDVVLYAPPKNLDEVFVAIVTEASPSGMASLFVYPTPSRREQVAPGVPHVTDERLFEENGFPSETCRHTGFWMFRPKQSKGKQ